MLFSRARSRSVLSWTAAAVTALVVAGCSSNEQPAGPVTLTILVDSTETTQKTVKALTDAFTAENPNITFDLVGVGPATGITRHYTSMPAMTQEIQLARIAGGMHFRTATVEGETLGRNVAQWIVANRFKAR